MSPNYQAIHKRLARFTAKRPPIPPGDGRCVRQTSVYSAETEKITACRCVRKENHDPPHRFRHPSGIVSELGFKMVKKPKIGPVKLGPYEYITNQKEFWAIADRKTGFLVCKSSASDLAIPMLLEKEEFARAVCGKKGKVVKVTLSW